MDQSQEEWVKTLQNIRGSGNYTHHLSPRPNRFWIKCGYNRWYSISREKAKDLGLIPE